MQFPDGTQIHTQLFPQPEERQTTIDFLSSTTGRSLVMNLRSREIHDDLTQLLLQKPARRMIEHQLTRLREKRFEGIVSVIMFDLDHFGQVNKNHGNPAGDKVLEWFSGILRRATRAGDIIGRFGGEEFVVFAAANKPQDEAKNPLTETTTGRRMRDQPWSVTERSETGITLTDMDALFNNGQRIASRVRQMTESGSVNIGGNGNVRVTVTAGVANAYAQPDSAIVNLFDTMYDLANEVLYRGKREDKRNQVHISSTTFVTPKTP